MTETPADAAGITALVTAELNRLGVVHVVVGSLASSLHGLPRSTNDVDIVAALRPEHVEPFVGTLEAGFYVDADMIRDAIRRRSEFNVIHLATMFKVDHQHHGRGSAGPFSVASEVGRAPRRSCNCRDFAEEPKE